MSKPLAAASTIRVELGERSYDIRLVSGQLESACRKTLETLAPVEHVVMIADQAVRQHVEAIEKVLDACKIRNATYLVPSGEGSKSVEQLARIWNWMFDQKTDRGSVVVALGGGVIGDLAGFASASFARGLRFVQIPSTLLAMVDSSVGGKTGINLPNAKNMVGAFWQPASVLIDIDLLSTLADREYRSGLAEIVKYGVILDQALFRYLEEHCAEILQRQPEPLLHIIRRSCELKAQVVAADERETTGLRACLNYGHTFGHAIEAATAYGTWLHGEAIAIGMTMAARLALILGQFSSQEAERQEHLLKRFQLPTQLANADPERLWTLMQHDKKVEQGKLRFILPTQIGQVERRAGVTREQACRAMQA